MVSAHAQTSSYPSRPIRAISGFPPGSSVDVVGRFVCVKLGERLGQQVVIDNRPGASGTIGADLAARAAPDGYTLFLVSVSQIMSAPVYKNLPFHPVKSFTAITPLAQGPLILATLPSFAPNTVKELIDLAKSKPDAVSYASAGNGSINHYAGALFARATGTQMLHVPHKGGAPAFFAVMGGQVNVMFATLPLSLTQIRAGKVKALGITSAKRSPLVPTVPSIAETYPGYNAVSWTGMLAPAGTPKPIIDKLAGEMLKASKDPKFIEQLKNAGIDPKVEGPEKFAAFIAAEIPKWTRLARDAQIQPE